MGSLRTFLFVLCGAGRIVVGAQGVGQPLWYFGFGAGLDLGATPPVALTDGAINTDEGCTTQCDSLGRLLFYTDGGTVWDRTHAPMLNGSGLFGHNSSSQSSLVVPFPGEPRLYYLFTTPAQMSEWSGEWGGATYSIIDMAGNGGLGEVVEKNVLLVDNVVEKLTATRHANGRDVWVLVHGWNSDRYYAYLVTCTGVLGPVESAVGTPIGPGAFDDTGTAQGCMQFDPQGTRLASTWGVLVDENNSYTVLEVLRFDKATGLLSDAERIVHEQPGQHVRGYGTAFSASGARLYLSEYMSIGAHILQYAVAGDALLGPTEQEVAWSDRAYGTLQRAPDGRIYVARLNGADHLARINAPEEEGAACDVEEAAVTLNGKYSTWGLPNHWDPGITVTAPQAPALRDTVVCGGEVTLDATVEHPFLVPAYLWSTGVTTAAIVVMEADTYTVRVVLGCDTLSAEAEVAFRGVSIDLGPDTLLCMGDSLHLLVPDESAGQLWSTGDTTRTLTVGEGAWSVVVDDGSGCLTVDTIIITAYDCTCPIHLPNTFTPNADGLNDRFGTSTACPISDYALQVFDRWGHVVWATSDPMEGWDGTMAGSPLPAGVFAWILRVRWWDGQREREERGHVLLLR